MAMKQGRCPNCGSLITVNDAENKAVCMFCNARFTPLRAIEIDMNPDGVEFPNESQDDLSDEEREIAFAAVRSVQVVAPTHRQQPPARKKKPVEPGKMTPQQKVAMQKKVLVEPLVSKKHKTMMISSISAVLLILIVIFLPITINRVSKGNQLTEQIDSIATYDVPNDAHYTFRGYRNTSLLLVSPEDLDDADVDQMMNNFKAVRADVYGIEDANNQNLELIVSAPNGSFVRNGKD